MLELLCLSDLHLGENYSFLSRPANWQPFYEGTAMLAGLQPSQSLQDVEIDRLVLLGDIFELATATISKASSSGRNFFDWLFGWLKPKEVIYIPGNHDHVFWMWWLIPEDPVDKRGWWEKDPKRVERRLARQYGALSNQVCDPVSPIGTQGIANRESLVKRFFGRFADTETFHLAYPAYKGPECRPPGSAGNAIPTLFTHGHLNDPTFVDPSKSGLTGWFMHLATGTWPEEADMTNLDSAERTTWKYTNYYWYPPITNTTFGEALYLCSTQSEEDHPCDHPRFYHQSYHFEQVPELKGRASAPQYFGAFASASVGQIQGEEFFYIYGHTHHGGTMPLVPYSLHLYNTGGWLSIVKDDPVHTHLFAIDKGIAKMVRVDFA